MKELNRYIDSVFYKKDDLLEEVLTTIEENGMRSISVSPSTGKLLTMLVSMTKAVAILEIGALGGYSGICLARGFGKDGRLTSLELEEKFAKLSKSNLTKAGFGNQVTYITGPALESLENLSKKGKKFDLFFIDADKDNYENYLEYCIRLAEPGALIIADNVLAGGSVADPSARNRRYTDSMKAFNKKVANHSQLESMLLPIGDGLTVSRVKK